MAAKAARLGTVPKVGLPLDGVPLFADDAKAKPVWQSASQKRSGTSSQNSMEKPEAGELPEFGRGSIAAATGH